MNCKPSAHVTPTLVGMADRSYADALLRCMESTGDIDFTLTDFVGYHVLQRICDLFPREAATGVLRAIVLHAERHPGDAVDWGQMAGGMDFIHWAALFGRLSLYYPVVRDAPYFADRVEQIELSAVREDDWAALSKEDRRNFWLEEY